MQLYRVSIAAILTGLVAAQNAEYGVSEPILRHLYTMLLLFSRKTSSPCALIFDTTLRSLLYLGGCLHFHALRQDQQQLCLVSLEYRP
jgi:hypothetical protein